MLRSHRLESCSEKGCKCFGFFTKGLRKMVIDCWIGPRAAHLGGQRKGSGKGWKGPASSRSLLCGMRQRRGVLRDAPGCPVLLSMPLWGPADAAGLQFSSRSTKHALLCPQVTPPCIPRDPARLEPGLTRASQREKAQYLRRRRGQLKFNVQANTSSPPLNQAAAVPSRKDGSVPVIKRQDCSEFWEIRGLYKN